MRGFTQSEALQLGLEGSLPPGTVEMFRGIVQEEIALDESGEADLNRSRVFEVELPHKNGTKINTEIVVSFLRDEQSHAVGVLGVTRDISARKQAEADRERLMSAIEQTSESLLIVDTNGNIQYQNPAYERTTGYSKDDSIGLIARFLSRDSQNQIILDEIWQTLRAGYIWRGQMVNIKKDGSPFTEETSISPIRDPQKEIVGYVIVARDITREKQLEEQLLQTQKIEAVGNLAGGIAHDFNNILTGIYGHAQLALDQIPSTHPANESVQGVIAASDRAAGLVSQILTFSRKSESDYVPVQLENVIDDALKLLRPTLPSTISIKEKLNVPGGMIFADPTQMHQVLLNLCTNAAGAMPTGGILEIILDEEEINSDIQPTLPRGTYVKLVVSDNGEGIEASNLNQIFDLFYTTKPVGKGTGFGLAVVHAIITECKGSISVESVVGEGTTFTILLPKYKSESEEILVEVNAPPTGEERVLLVDDEEMVTQVHKRLLEANGYHVTVTNSSLSAAHIFKTNPEDFDIVITDQTMPDMTGDELSQELQKIRPNIPIILCTGYSEDMDESKAASLGISKFLLKPVTREDLLMTIRAAIDGK